MTTFDPEAPLPGPPDPWAASGHPTPRGGPPFHMTDMIAVEPALAGRLLAALAAPAGPAAALATEIASALARGESVVVTGCGTSEHAALAVAGILAEATSGRSIRSEQAFELALDPPSAGLVIGISHEGGTAATNQALESSRAAGARTALITVTRRSPGAAHADLVVETGELDQSWCHTVGYLSPIVAATAVGAHVAGRPIDSTMTDGVRDLVAAGIRAAGTTSAASADTAGAADAIARRLAGVRTLLVVASGADRPAGREFALKVEEGSWLPAAYRDLETFLHGHLAATDEETALVVILTDRRGRSERVERTRDVVAAARVIGMPAAAIVTAGADDLLAPELTPAGRIVVPDAEVLPAAVAASLGTATPLQLVTERLARARGIDPDPIHRDVERYRAAADAARRD